MRKPFTLFALVILVVLLALVPVIALAQDAGAPHEEVKLGHYTLPFILTMVLSVIYLAAGDSIPNRAKPLIALGVGTALGIICLFYAELVPTFKNVVDYVLFGLMAGASAIGLYEGQKALRSTHR